MTWFDNIVYNLFNKHDQSKYIGYIWGRTRWVDKDGKHSDGDTTVGYWILTIDKHGKRKVKLVGQPGNSQHATHARMQVEAWIAGGPLPSDLIEDDQMPPQGSPIQNPNEKPTPPIKKEGNVLSFPQKDDNE